MVASPSRPAWAAEILGLVLPVECAGCGRWDVAVCPACREALDRPLVRCEDGAPALAARPDGAPGFPTWATAPYAGAVRGVVVAWKGRPNRAVAAAVAETARRAGREWGSTLDSAGLLLRGEPAVVVPAPSGLRRRAQGRFVVGALAAEIAAGLVDAGGDVTVVDALRRSGGRRHQSGLGTLGRLANRTSGTRVAEPVPAARACLLVDDVVTTGATLAECRRTLVAAGHDVRAAFVLAAAPSPRRVR